MIPRRAATAWLLWLALVLAFLGGSAGCLEREWADAPSTTAAALEPTTDPNADVPGHGAPHQPLPPNPAGWADNQNGAKFPHYGRIEFRLCDLPANFMSLSEGLQRKWCRKQLEAANHPMPPSFTNHELVETRDGERYLVVYKVDRADHASSGRPRLYHPPDPARGGNTYRGGIAQLRDEAAHRFKRRLPPRPPRPPPHASTSSDGPESCGVACEVCVECATTPEEAVEWCDGSCADGAVVFADVVDARDGGGGECDAPPGSDGADAVDAPDGGDDADAIEAPDGSGDADAIDAMDAIDGGDDVQARCRDDRRAEELDGLDDGETCTGGGEACSGCQP